MRVYGCVFARRFSKSKRTDYMTQRKLSLQFAKFAAGTLVRIQALFVGRIALEAVPFSVFVALGDTDGFSKGWYCINMPTKGTAHPHTVSRTLLRLLLFTTLRNLGQFVLQELAAKTASTAL